MTNHTVVSIAVFITAIQLLHVVYNDKIHGVYKMATVIIYSVPIATIVNQLSINTMSS